MDSRMNGKYTQLHEAFVSLYSDRPTDGQTDGSTDGRMDGPTKRGLELRSTRQIKGNKRKWNEGTKIFFCYRRIFTCGHATTPCRVGRSVGLTVRHISEFRAVFALLLQPNHPRLSCRVSSLVLVACYTTTPCFVGPYICPSVCRSIHPLVYQSVCHLVCLSIGLFIRPTITLYFFLFWAHCPCPNDLMTLIMAPAHPHATGVAVFWFSSL